MRIPCYTWQADPVGAAEYLKVIRQFGSNDEMRLWAEDYVHGHAGRLRWDVEFLAANYPFASCVNVGGAPFLFEYLMLKSRQDLRLLSLDLNITRFPKVPDVLGMTVVEANIEQNEELPELIGQFECVVFCEIFEHLRLNLLQTMQRVSQLIAPGGILYLTMP